ncbi:EamA family transporter RarD [Aurantiacibacter spongiae]|uniref:EamA family transporter RarD n=1 Tax=Aurantiacibacter spongiae TaxID=2488860 RepID=A0A3N5CVZ0_9SPHN|nr:EamA family transporter RarD [Aurantiacibacter spongiae]RPF70819.1 EamA family transporter RarD [Aurantiacibacter spongiae]
MRQSEIGRGRALLYGLGTHAIWGSMPVYLLLVHKVPPVEYVAWRTLLTMPICLAVVWLTGRAGELRSVFGNWRTLRTLTATATLIAVNWLVYVWSIQQEYVYAASLGYYVLPLNMMLLARVFLKERLTGRQKVAVTLAAIGVGALATGALTTLWITITLATSFGVYGLLRKTVDAGPIVGLTVEAIILSPVVLVYFAWLEIAGPGITLGRDFWESVGIVLGGPYTAIPLILFATAARALPYTVVGFLQFISPTLIFIIGLTVFGEELKLAQLVCFVLIWAAIALFTWDLWRNARRRPQAMEALQGTQV